MEVKQKLASVDGPVGSRKRSLEVWKSKAITNSAIGMLLIAIVCSSVALNKKVIKEERCASRVQLRGGN